jgi:hypothetical protein
MGLTWGVFPFSTEFLIDLLYVADYPLKILMSMSPSALFYCLTQIASTAKGSRSAKAVLRKLLDISEGPNNEALRETVRRRLICNS